VKIIKNPLFWSGTKNQVSSKGDLSGVQVYKFRFQKRQMLLAYAVSLDHTQFVLIGYGVHENFYRDLKR